MEELQAEEQAEDDIDRRKLSELIDLWYEGTGRELSDNIRTKRILESFVKVIGDIEARKLTISHFNQYKKEKREEQYQGRTITDNTLNKHLGYLSRVYNYLIEIEEIDYKNPLRKLRMIKLDERELTFLTLNQVERVIAQKVLV
ncbi:phage integrase [Endozoicomonas atrinae]|uniref:phage integrase n=1 Tax=Endozoicomonas atrinae TaxID=1333660 RepID=UPI003B007F35